MSGIGDDMNSEINFEDGLVKSPFSDIEEPIRDIWLQDQTGDSGDGSPVREDNDKGRVADYDYELPPELIAQDPLADRSSSRLLVLDPADGRVEHRRFTDIRDYLSQGDVLVCNDTRVIPARLYGTKAVTGAHIEVLLLKRLSDNEWECLVKPGAKAKPGTVIEFGAGAVTEAVTDESKGNTALTGEVTDVMEEGVRRIRFSYEGIWEEVLDRLGEMPLPPYITHALPRENRDRYQTVYARYEGSAAAPTAGLHFTPELLREVESMGVKIVYVTLHVGLGTFRPVKVDNIEDHHMHSEWYEISREAAAAINEAKLAGHRVVCVGTTSVRTIESASTEDGLVYPGSGDTSIFIYPGYRFRVVDRLITNFHLPKSTLMMLVSALAGREHILNAYQRAIEERYRFFSFGDAMLIL